MSAIATGERLVLDPGPGELDLNQGPVRVAQDGPDWGEAAIEAATADAVRGTIPIDYRIPNRQITIPLVLGADGGARFMDARSLLQTHVGRIQAYGGMLWRGGGTTDSLYADIVNATLKVPEKWAHMDAEVDVVLTLEAIPDFYGEEISRPVRSSTGAEVVFAEHGIRGDYPGRARIVVTDREGQVKNGVLWGIRSHYYDPAPTAQVMYAATDLGSGGATAGADWTDLRPGRMHDGEPFTHRGTYRIWIRASTTAPARVRLAWGLGDLSAPAFNQPISFPATGSPFMLDLGEVRLDPAPLGRHHWSAVIQGIRTGGSDATVQITAVYLQPVAELAGKVWVPPDRPTVTGDPDAAVPAGGSVELRTDGIWREETHGIHPPGVELGYLPASHVIGDLPRLYPGSNEMFVHVTRGDYGTQPDPQLAAGAFESRIYYRPSFLNPMPSAALLRPTITSPQHNSRIQDETPPVTGTGQPGNTVMVQLNGVPLGTAVVDASGTWTIGLPGPLAFRKHTITAQQADPAENISEPVSVTFTVQIWSWDDLIDQYPTWNAVKAAFSTWDRVVRNDPDF